MDAASGLPDPDRGTRPISRRARACAVCNRSTRSCLPDRPCRRGHLGRGRVVADRQRGSGDCVGRRSARGARGYRGSQRPNAREGCPGAPRSSGRRHPCAGSQAGEHQGGSVRRESSGARPRPIRPACHGTIRQHLSRPGLARSSGRNTCGRHSPRTPGAGSHKGQGGCRARRHAPTATAPSGRGCLPEPSRLPGLRGGADPGPSAGARLHPAEGWFWDPDGARLGSTSGPARAAQRRLDLHE